MKKSALVLTFLFISIVFVSSSVAEKNQAGRDAEVSRYYHEIVSLLSSGSFSEITVLMNNVLKSKKQGVNGKRHLEAIYDEFLTFDDVDLLNNWCNSSNSSHFAFVVRGGYYLNRVRSYYHPFDVFTSKPGKEYQLNDDLGKAQADLEKAHDLNPQDPTSAAAMISISMFRGYPNQVMEQWFLTATTADPFWVGSYKNKLRYLSPNRLGSVKEMYNFAVNQTKLSPPGSSVYSVLFEYFDILNSYHYPVNNNIFYSLNLPSKAHKLFQPTIERYKRDFPESTIPTLYEGKYNFLQAEPGTAQKLFSNILIEEPENIEALQAQIIAQMSDTKWKKTEVDLELFLKLAPNATFAISNLGAITTLQDGDTLVTEKLYSQAISLENSPYLKKMYYLDLATLMDSKKKYTEAIKAYDGALKIHPTLERAILGRAESKYKGGNIDAAIEDLLILVDMGGRYKTVSEERIEEYRNVQIVSAQVQGYNQTSTPSKIISQQSGSLQTADITLPAPAKPGQILVPGTTEKLVLDCEGFYYRKMTAEAIECYSSLLSTMPSHRHGQPYFMLGKIAETQEYNLPKAINYYGQALSKDPGNEKYILKLGESFYMNRQFDKAIAVFSKLIEINNVHGKAFYMRGLCFDEKGEREKAIADMQRARMYDPSITGADSYLAQYAAKKPVVNKISREDELLQLAEDNMRLQRFDEAEQQFKELLELNDQNDYAHFRLGILYRTRDRDHQRAIGQYDRAIAITQDRSDYYLNRASGLKFIGKLEAAIDDLTNLIRLKPTNASAYSSRGSCYMKIGDYKNAEKDFQSALKYSPGNKSYMRNFAEASSKNGTGQRSITEDAEMLMARARVYISQKDYESAQTDLLKAIELDSNNSEPYYLLGKLCDEKLKKKDDAIEYYSQAIELNKGKRDYFFKRGLVYYHQQKYESSISDFDQALDISPKDGQILYYRGNCHRNLGHKDQAIDDYLKVKQYAPSWTEAVNSHLEALM